MVQNTVLNVFQRIGAVRRQTFGKKERAYGTVGNEFFIRDRIKKSKQDPMSEKLKITGLEIHIIGIETAQDGFVFIKRRSHGRPRGVLIFHNITRHIFFKAVKNM